MYISILDYIECKVIIVKIPKNSDAEDYVSMEYGLDNVEWMVMDELKLEIK